MNARYAALAGIVGFQLLSAAWVWYDARARGATKPALAAFFVLFAGPLWMAFYLADRPLCADERREGGFGWNMARYFVQSWTIVNLPIVLVLVITSFTGGDSLPANERVRWLLWCIVPIAVAMALGLPARRREIVEEAGTATRRARLSFVVMYALLTIAYWTWIAFGATPS